MKQINAEYIKKYVATEILKNSVKMCLNDLSLIDELPESIYIEKKIFNKIMGELYVYGKDALTPMFLTEREYNGVTRTWLAIPKTI